MNDQLMIKYLGEVVAPYLNGRNGLLLLDSYGAHCTQAVLDKMASINLTCAIIPGGTTDILQPLDVSINKPLKAVYMDAWNEWFIDESQAVYTKSGNRQKPPYAKLVEMTMGAIHYVESKPEMIKRSFLTCGVSASSFFSASFTIHTRLHFVLSCFSC